MNYNINTLEDLKKARRPQNSPNGETGERLGETTMLRTRFYDLPVTGESYPHEAIHRVLTYLERQRAAHSIYSGPQPDAFLHRGYIEAGYVAQAALRRAVAAATNNPNTQTQTKGTETHA